MVDLLLTVFVVLIVVGIVWWAITQIPLPPPADWIVRVVFGLVVALIILDLLLDGHAASWHLRY